MNYAPKPHSHVVPAGYLRAWAQGEKVAMQRVGSNEAVEISVKDAGVRKNFYRRTRPSGETSWDIEWSLEQGEGAAIPVIRSIQDRWPLDDEDKSKIGQFFALQHVRGNAFKSWHDQQVAAQAAELRTNPKSWGTPPEGMSYEEAVERYISENLQSDTNRLTMMLKLVRSVGTVMQSMHWTLVTFKKGRLATSDHPVIVWPIARTRLKPVANNLNAGVTDTLEIFAPVGPDALLLMTWLHDEDRQQLAAGTGRHLSTANSYVIANADVQWFHEPGVTAWIAKGQRPPLSTDLVEGYDLAGAIESPRRAKAIELGNAVAKQEINNDPLPMVTVGRSSNST